MTLITHLQQQLLEVDELIHQLEDDASKDPRPSVLANIRALQKEQRKLQEEFDTAANRAESAVYKYRVIPDGRATIKHLASVWSEFQDLFSAAYMSVRGGAPKPKRGKKAAEVDGAVSAPQLAYAYSFQGSIGVAMTLPRIATEGLATGIDDAIERATNIIFDLAKAEERGENIAPLARRLGPSVVAAMHKWADAHVAAGFGVGIEWRRDEHTVDSVTLQFQHIEKLKDDLSETTFESEVTVTGSLVAVHTENATFVVRSDTGEVYTGTYENVISAEHRAMLPSRYKAVIKTVKKAILAEGEDESPRYVLVSLAAIE